MTNHKADSMIQAYGQMDIQPRILKRLLENRDNVMQLLGKLVQEKRSKEVEYEELRLYSKNNFLRHTEYINQRSKMLSIRDAICILEQDVEKYNLELECVNMALKRATRKNF